jgi:hypothetical protein
VALLRRANREVRSLVTSAINASEEPDRLSENGLARRHWQLGSTEAASFTRAGIHSRSNGPRFSRELDEQVHCDLPGSGSYPPQSGQDEHLTSNVLHAPWGDA